MKSIEGKTIILNTKDDNRFIRECLNLPLTKELVFMEQNKNGFVKRKAISIKIAKEYQTWYELDVNIEKKAEPIRIYSDYFAEMQNLDFEKRRYE